MPVIVQLGQCGNQIGFDLADRLWQEGYRDGFFVEKSNGKTYARSVLVDMEPKVIDGIVNRSQSREWNYSKTAAITARSGSGNNWSYGYSVLGKTLILAFAIDPKSCDFHDFISIPGKPLCALGFFSTALC